MIFKTALMLLFLFAVASCQTSLPGWVTWDYNYNANNVPYNDSTSIMFDVYHGLSLIDTNYVMLGNTQAHTLRLLTYDVLYNNTGWFLFCRASALSDGALSLNSDTIYAYFPIIIEGEPYNFRVIKTKLP